LDSQIVQIAKDVMKRRTSKLYIKGGNSVADENMLGSPQYPEKIRMNIPIVVLGNRGGNFHQINEWVDITSIYQMEKNVFEICQEWHQYYLKQAHV
jgi:di/tripeptidase